MMYSSSKILLLNNKPDLARDLQFFLSEEFGVVNRSHQSKEALLQIFHNDYDLLILSNNLDDREGTEFIRELRKNGATLPFIMIAGNGGIKQAVEAMKLGAVDFLQWSDDKEAFYPFVKEVVKKALHDQVFKNLFSEGELIYKTLFENLRDAVFLHLIDEKTRRPGFFIEVNPVACRRLGYSRQEFASMRPEDMELPGTVDQEKIISKLLEEGSAIFNSFHKAKDGRVIPVEINSRIFDLRGQKAVLSVARNITDQQRILNDLKKSELRFRSIIEKSFVGICISNDRGILEYANDAFCKISGYSSEETVGRHFSDFFLDDLKQKVFDLCADFFHSGKTDGKTELVMMDRLGNQKYVIIDSILISDIDGHLRGVTFVEDITEERLAKHALEMSELKYRTMMEALHDPVFISDDKFNIVYANSAFKKRFGYVDKHTKCYNHVFGENAPCPWCISAIREMSKIRKRQERTINKRVYQITTMPIELNGNFQAKMTILRDVTKVVKARKKAEESDRLKSAFLANISHEIRTPLNAVLGFSNLLKDEQLTRDEMSMYIDMINESSSNLLHVIDNIIEFSFVDSGLVKVSPTQIKIDRLFDFLYKETEQLMERLNKKHLQMVFENFLPDGFEIVNDEVRIRQVLQNLLSNAVKFTEMGEITLSAYYDENKWVVFSVKDTGIGIPKNMHSVIFRRFRQGDEGYTRMFGGNGLGLALSKNLAEMIGGHIKVHSMPGKGSEFKFYMPAKFDESLAKALSVEYVR
ncbi:PAS domain S-box protein [Thermophagus sp. OGC60D27]|uniref:PAS domain S-box protein n=1 Tax=Thermophagus sp. OGC60D27 TaxID=3458415 RepID=UPI004037F212